MKDEELFELCRDLYKSTGWLKHGSDLEADFYFATNDLEFKTENYELISREHHHFPGGYIGQDFIPLFTSDFLLTKLQLFLSGERRSVVLKVRDGIWYVDADNIYIGPRLNGVDSDTPLKALLKLTIALHDVGELK